MKTKQKQYDRLPGWQPADHEVMDHLQPDAQLERVVNLMAMADGLNVLFSQSHDDYSNDLLFDAYRKIWQCIGDCLMGCGAHLVVARSQVPEPATILFECHDEKPIPVPQFRPDGSRREPDGETVFTLAQAVEKFGRSAEVLEAMHQAMYEPVEAVSESMPADTKPKEQIDSAIHVKNFDRLCELAEKVNRLAKEVGGYLDESLPDAPKQPLLQDGEDPFDLISKAADSIQDSASFYAKWYKLRVRATGRAS